jgi:hypothetical protein
VMPLWQQVVTPPPLFLSSEQNIFEVFLRGLQKSGSVHAAGL